jgi:tetratricopeptide (TPR) repeat protein
LRAYYNLADFRPHTDRYDEAIAFDSDGLALARRVGNRFWELSFLGHGYPLFALGEWDRAVEQAPDLSEVDWTRNRTAFAPLLTSQVQIHVHRGQLEEAGRVVDLVSDMADSAEVQERVVHASSRAAVLLHVADYPEALRYAGIALAGVEALAITHEAIKEAFLIAVEAAFGANDLGKVEELLEIVGTLPPGERTQFLDAQWARFRARLDVRKGETQDVEARFKGAAGALREISAVFHLATVLVDFGAWLTADGRRADAEPLFDEARGIFERLGATPWLERLDAVVGQRSTVG